MSKLTEWSYYERPLQALQEMSVEQRDRIRMTLKIKLPPKLDRTKEIESKLIIGAKIYGIASRLHLRWEQLNPFIHALTWRDILIRIITVHLSMHFSADFAEEELEKIILEELTNNPAKANKKNNSEDLPVSGFIKIHKKAGMIIEIIKDADQIIDTIIGSTDAPAICAVLSICAYLHKVDNK